MSQVASTALESISGWAKHQILDNCFFETVAELRAAVEHYFHQRVAQARQRRGQVCAKALAAVT